MTLTQLLTDLEKKATFKCGCEACSSRYCDDDIDKARDYKKEIPILIKVIRHMLASIDSTRVLVKKTREADMGFVQLEFIEIALQRFEDLDRLLEEK